MEEQGQNQTELEAYENYEVSKKEEKRAKKADLIEKLLISEDDIRWQPSQGGVLLMPQRQAAKIQLSSDTKENPRARMTEFLKSLEIINLYSETEACRYLDLSNNNLDDLRSVLLDRVRNI